MQSFEHALIIFTFLFIIRRPLFDRINFQIIAPFLEKILLNETYLCDYCLGFFLVLVFAERTSILIYIFSILKIYGLLVLLLKAREYLER